MRKEVTLENVAVSRLRSRLNAYKALFATLLERHQVQVKGRFEDRRGEIVFLMEWRDIDVPAVEQYDRRRSYWLTAMIDGQWTHIRPLDGIIECVKIGIYTQGGGSQC